MNLFATISAILHLGNLAIVEDSEGHAAITNDSHLKAPPPPPPPLPTIARTH